jgi:hypothetical protein
MRILIIGIPHFTSMLSSILSIEDADVEYYGLTESCKIRLGIIPRILKADVIYCIWGTISRKNGLYFKLAALANKKVYMHWIGTDILKAKDCFEKGNWDKRIVRDAIHWAEVPWTAKELEEIGIHSEVVPLASTIFPEVVPPLPDQFTILTYLPDDRLQFYGSEFIERLAEDIPEVTILVLSGGKNEYRSRHQNVKCLGWVPEISDIYSQGTVLVRMTEHDGLSFMVLESLAHGRHVIWTYPYPGVISTKSYPSLKEAILRLYKMHKSGELCINQEGREYVLREHQPRKIARHIIKKLREPHEEG